MRSRLRLTLLAVAAAFPLFAAAAFAMESTIPGTGAVSGSVTAPKPFTAAQVYLKHTEKPVTFMVYTSGGKFQAMNLFPGEYEVRVARRGFQSEARKIVVQAGQTTPIDLAMKEADLKPQPGVNGPASVVAYPGRETITAKDVEFHEEYDKVYPPGPGRVVLERVCMSCHGQNFFSLKQWDRMAWDAAINMMSRRIDAMDVHVPPGKMSPGERALLLDYLAANFTPESKKRALAMQADFPVDEAALAKAMYVEYDLPKTAAANAKPRGQNPNFGTDGYVWTTDRGFPNAIVRLDPATATFQRYDLPEQGIPHGITVDADNVPWWGETVGFKLGRLDPKTGKMERMPLDARGFIKGRGHDPIVDREQNVWLTVIRGNQLAKWDRKTGRISLYEPPTANSYPYGADEDKQGNIWMSQFVQCRMAKFDPKEESWTEYPVLTAFQEDPYCLVRRGSVDDKGNVWYGVFSNGKIGKIDAQTEKMQEWKVPAAFSEPYDIVPDRDGNLWIADGAMGGALIKFEPTTEKFTFYPAVQRGDIPKLEITREGAIWYNPRSALQGAVGVLYPDMTKMTSFAASR